jgi:preprotein translocase subunit YajC
MGGGDSSGGWLNLLMWMVPLFVIMYVLMIRPQRVKDKERREMLSKLKKNDHIVTIGGIYGTVAAIRDKDLTLKVDESSNTKLRVSRSAIARVVSGEEASEEGGELS